LIGPTESLVESETRRGWDKRGKKEKEENKKYGNTLKLCRPRKAG